MNHADNKKQGFTLIELMLAMTFLSILLIAIALTILQVVNIYNHGITIKEVNQSGQTLSSDMEQSINSSSPFAISGAGSKYISQPYGGRLCLGNYSYIWNYGTVLQPGISPVPTRNMYTGESAMLTTDSNPIKFVKVVDGGGAYCSSPNSKIDPANSVELLNVSDHDLAIHSLTVTSEQSAVDSKTGERLYNITFVVGTNDSQALTSDGSACKPPSVSGSDVAFCSVQQFNVVASAGNTVE